MKTATLLKHARAQIQKGWCQFSLKSLEGEYCAWGAIYFSRPSAAYREAYDLVFAATGGDCFRLSDWNDAPGRTKEDVLEAFDIAIAHAEGAGI